MRWLDVFGPPGVGKSALCDPLWSPHAINWQDPNLQMPAEWEPFMRLCMTYLGKVKNHPTFDACARMTQRSVRKMAAVHWDQRPDVYVQTGFAQRGLGFGWRLEDPEEVRAYFEAMPVSLGCVALYADEKVIIERNKLREQNPETAHENRSEMVPLMKRPFAIAVETLSKRVPTLLLNADGPLEEARSKLIEFRDKVDRPAKTFHSEPFRPDYQEAIVSTYVRW